MKSFAQIWGAAAFGLAMLGSVAAHADDVVTLKMVGAWAHGFSPTAEVGKNFMENVNRLGEGKVKVQYVGADDVLPPFDQPEALVNGVFDVWYGAPNYWAGIVPGGDITELSPLTIPDGGPGSPLYDYMVQLYAAKGVRHLGHAAGDPGEGAHYVSTNFPVKSVDDLKGKKLRVAPLTRHFVQAAGAESVTLPPSEIFLAMDRGTVEGFSWPVADAFTRYGWQNVTKYMIEQPMYRSGGSVAMNLDKWESLSPEVQDILLKAIAETQRFALDWFQKNQEEQQKIMVEAGMEIVKLSDEEAKRWDAVARDSLWAYYETALDAKHIGEIKALFESK
ncbi:TRAP transporter substrate-binding protein DctP [Pseudaminobacter sp. 19-2017]|uniref:TRAP transporter substrate-binding protein DctP n=1 Tax=Pseudaminobacter soli (ex Zhang et al. 2022) TaxID=2831468 RepID=A0A942I3N0_9HYPH|nr:TRAP transporter substrate-binding protein DctP [Pseudaminobacter soli]MBS3650568.1 TRAP transporter substrate-binding protein DctP [Pseudaminobacter soli]